MQAAEQIESSGNKELGQQGYSHKTEHSKETGGLQSNTVMQECVNKLMRQGTLDTSKKIRGVLSTYNDAEELPIEEAVQNMAEGFLKVIKDAKEKKVLFSVQFNSERGGSAVIDQLIGFLDHLMNRDTNIKENEKLQLEPVLSEVVDLIAKGCNVRSREQVSRLLPENKLKELLEKHDNYLSSLKKIVCDSIENGDKEDIVVQRDNPFYCVKCPEESVVVPAKFMNSPEFKDLEYGALKIGKGNVIRIQNGQYHDMKGEVKMTFKVSDDEKIEMILSSEEAESFGKIMVRMDDRSCETFQKYRGELEKESRISKVVEAAKSFVQDKPPLSSVDDTNVQQLQGNVQSLGGQN